MVSCCLGPGRLAVLERWLPNTLPGSGLVCVCLGNAFVLCSIKPIIAITAKILIVCMYILIL